MSAKAEIPCSLSGQQSVSPLAQEVFKQQNLDLLRETDIKGVKQVGVVSGYFAAPCKW